MFACFKAGADSGRQQDALTVLLSGTVGWLTAQDTAPIDPARRPNGPTWWATGGLSVPDSTLPVVVGGAVRQQLAV
jgi:hypothetical protein